MVDSIAAKLLALKAARDGASRATGRDLVVLKSSIVDAELARLDIRLRPLDGASRMVSSTAYGAGGAVGDAFAVDPAIGTRGG